jgi:uncharacterized protein (TIGR03437 family)
MLRKSLLSLSLLSVSLLSPVLPGQSLHAQTTDLPACFAGLDQATVGVPYYCDFGAALNQLIAQFIDQETGVSLKFTFGVTAGSTLPPGLTITQSGVYSGTPTTPGSFSFSIDITYNITVSGQSFSATEPFPSFLQVNGLATSSTIVNPAGLVFALNQGTTTSSQSISLSSRRSQPITYTATATTISGGSWLSVTGSGTINPFQSTSAVVSVNAAGLAAGVYAGAIQLSLSSNESFTLPVILTTTSSQQSLVISQSGVYFQAVQGGTSPPAQSISVLNGGSGSLNFSASASVLSGGNWLSVSPSSGTATSASGAPVSISVNSAGLAAGTYYGKVQISATGIANSPQTASVVLLVASPAQSPGPSLSSTGLIFVARAGGAAASARSITVTNPSPNPLNFSSTAFSDTSTNFYTVSPANGTLTSGQPVNISVQPAAGLAAGVYTGSVTLLFADATTQTTYQHRLAVVLIVVPGLGGGAQTTGSGIEALRPQTTAGCTPAKLILVFTQLGDAFKIPAGWPAPLEVTVVDDCGSFMTQGSVITTFSTGDPPLALSSLKDGRWSGTWEPRNSSSAVTIVAQGQETLPALRGSAQVGGGLQANPLVPVIDAGGVVSAASNAVRQPLAPGSYISVYGKNLSLSSNLATTLPLQTQLGGTQVILAGKALPLIFAGNGQINAIVPFDTPVNTQQQLIVQEAASLSVPEPVVLSATQPAVFTQDNSGSGLGVIVGFKADHSASFVIDHTHPVSAGDVLVIYATGLGAVDQPVAVGTAGPSLPLANTVNTVTATVGGQNASVAFAGLAPGLTVYQVNVVVPNGVAPGSNVPVVLIQAGQQSLPVTIAVQ